MTEPVRPRRAEKPPATKQVPKVGRRRMDPEVEDELTAKMAGKKPIRTAKVEKPRGGVANALRDEQPDGRKQITFRIGKRWSQIITEVKDGQYTWEEFTESLDPEELVRGQLKDRNGRFQGRPPALVPRAFHDACQRELHRRFNDKIRDRLLGAVDELIELSKASGGMEAKDRAKVLTYLIERVMGPVPKQVNISTDQPWEGLVTQGLLRPAVDGTGPAATPPRRDRYAKRRKAVDAAEDVDE